MNGARVIFIHGPAAAGKYTIAKELSRITGIALFHNHLTVDLLLPLFPFASPRFVHHRERIWLELIGDAVEAGRSLIFTFNPERSVSLDFPRVLTSRVEGRGGSVSFVEIDCPDEEIVKRIESVSRQEFRKLGSLELYRKLKFEGAFDYPRIASELAIDSSLLSPDEAALRIRERLRLPSAAEA